MLFRRLNSRIIFQHNINYAEKVLTFIVKCGNIYIQIQHNLLELRRMSGNIIYGGEVFGRGI